METNPTLEKLKEVAKELTSINGGVDTKDVFNLIDRAHSLGLQEGRKEAVEETNQKCCDPEAHGKLCGKCEKHLCRCHPQEEKEWEKELDELPLAVRYKENGYNITDFDYLKDQIEQVIKPFIRQQKHLSYQAGLKFAIDFIASREGWEETKDFYLKSLTSELDKEVN